MRIIHVPSMPASMTGDDLVVALVKHGYAPSRRPETSEPGTVVGSAQSL